MGIADTSLATVTFFNGFRFLAYVPQITKVCTRRSVARSASHFSAADAAKAQS
jgi:hypothetical protein